MDANRISQSVKNTINPTVSTFFLCVSKSSLEIECFRSKLTNSQCQNDNSIQRFQLWTSSSCDNPCIELCWFRGLGSLIYNTQMDNIDSCEAGQDIPYPKTSSKNSCDEITTTTVLDNNNNNGERTTDTNSNKITDDEPTTPDQAIQPNPASKTTTQDQVIQPNPTSETTTQVQVKQPNLTFQTTTQVQVKQPNLTSQTTTQDQVTQPNSTSQTTTQDQVIQPNPISQTTEDGNRLSETVTILGVTACLLLALITIVIIVVVMKCKRFSATDNNTFDLESTADNIDIGLCEYMNQISTSDVDSHAASNVVGEDNKGYVHTEPKK